MRTWHTIGNIDADLMNCLVANHFRFHRFDGSLREKNVAMYVNIHFSCQILWFIFKVFNNYCYAMLSCFFFLFVSQIDCLIEIIVDFVIWNAKWLIFEKYCRKIKNDYWHRKRHRWKVHIRLIACYWHHRYRLFISITEIHKNFTISYFRTNSNNCSKIIKLMIEIFLPISNNL